MNTDPNDVKPTYTVPTLKIDGGKMINYYRENNVAAIIKDSIQLFNDNMKPLHIEI